jgi:ribosomal protein S18 acetylase RimI-like enzyme
MDVAMTSRTAEAEDAEAISALTREAHAEWVPVVGREQVPMKVDYADAVRRHRFDLLFASGTLAALIETTPQGEALLIENLAVRPAFQGRGYGVRLLALAETLAEAAGLAGTRLYTNKRFAENVRLYTSLAHSFLAYPVPT